LEKITQRGATGFVLFANYNYNYQIEDGDVGGVCSANGGEEDRVEFTVGKEEEKNWKNKI
jgi:hypothetical protein